MPLRKSKYRNPEDVLRRAPGPSPWYLREFSPELPDNLNWSDGYDGKMFLKNSNGEILAIFDYYCYVLSMSKSRLLVWHMVNDNMAALYKNAEYLRFSVLDLNNLPPIPNIQIALHRLKEEKLTVFHLDDNAETFLLPTDLDNGEHSIEFSAMFKEFTEILVLAFSTAWVMTGNAIDKKSLCLFILKPTSKRVEIFPQDWFNRGDLDYGYQWVTRVARDPDSGRIFGEGFRISPFVLDESLREVEHWFGADP